MNIPGLSTIGNFIENCVETVSGDKNSLEQLKSVVSRDQMVQSKDSFGSSTSPEALLGKLSNQTEWMGTFTKNLQSALDAMKRGYSMEEWNQKFSNAVDVLQNNFDLLDTSAGIGGKDGRIGKNDLLAALGNPNMPKEVKDACKFLLKNEAAWNQLDVGAGIGNCDGIIAKCDVDAVSKKLADQAEAANGSESGDEVDAADDPEGIDAADDPDRTGNVGDTDQVGDTEDVGSTNDASPTGPEATSKGKDIESLVAGLMESLDNELDAKTKELDEMIRSGKRDTHTLTLELQRIAEQRKQMFELLSTLSKMHNEMAKTAIQNMGRA